MGMHIAAALHQSIDPGEFMSNDVVLPNEYALVLLRKLADDDAFRSAYECNPIQALHDIGVPDRILDGLSAEHRAPLKLASKETFKEALYQLIDEAALVCICQVPPQVKLSFGTPTDAGHRRSTTSFEAP